jgi:hypothetical protein
LGDKERGEMFLELEATTKELKEQKWKLDQLRSFITHFNQLLEAEALDKALTILEKPENKPLLNLEVATELIRTVLKLETKKTELEKKLGMKVTLE